MKYAIFGGSFDPIHRGHVRMADAAVKELSLDKLYFMPNYVSPFKLDQKVTPPDYRVEMIKRVLDYNNAFELSEYEIRREEPSYTIETLEYFTEAYGEGLHFVLGYDSVMTIDKWYRGKEILSRYPLITARRPGTSDGECSAKIEEYRYLYNTDITILELEPFEAASSDIRKMAANGEPIDRYVLPSVEEYIKLHEIYR